ncbi:outer membrane protein OmpA-like peptidoglycan-associated protein [Roseinatronobacter thiooxidans]|uniref:Outer membrane protein OmpA-like peptidoglycan-associated protein n=2 Tax=Roseinatronobacter thiooxidans TaxID=121821 RepID=A0A2W7QCX5_9RHOB|nr:outer membrane protein OmpA-like peptidoglycan-associated protein [Roseinatronobacter thiooxidans]
MCYTGVYRSLDLLEERLMKVSVSTLSLGAAVLALAACAPDPNNTQNRTLGGALTGAAVGGVIGAATGDGRRAAAGAIIGGTTGALIGQQLDRQAAELRRQLGDNVNVRNTGQELILTLPQDLLFATDSATLRPDLQADLRTIASNLVNFPRSDVIVVGHTDNTGTAAYNQNLSERRAGSVAQVLRAQGVASNRIQTQGRGLTQPVASNATPAGRAQNRRVEIFIRPHQPA